MRYASKLLLLPVSSAMIVQQVLSLLVTEMSAKSKTKKIPYNTTKNTISSYDVLPGYKLRIHGYGQIFNSVPPTNG